METQGRSFGSPSELLRIPSGAPPYHHAPATLPVRQPRAHHNVRPSARLGSVPRWMRAAVRGPVQLPQAPAEGFNLLLVGNLLALSQFERLQHVLHVIERASERFDDLVDLLDCFLDSHRFRRSPLPLRHLSLRSRLPESRLLFGAWLPDSRRLFGSRFPELWWGGLRRLAESAQRFLLRVGAVARRGFEALAARGFCDRDRRGFCVARVELFQIVQALRPLRRVSVRDPCFLQIALNNPKCNRNYAAPEGNNVIASRTDLGFGLRRETELQASGPPACPYLDYCPGHRD